jgi:hypothetical protein
MSGKGAKGLAGKGAKGTMAGDKKGDKKKPISRSAKAGLQFPVGRIHRFLKVRPPRPTRLRSATHTPYQNPHAWTSPGHFQTHALVVGPLAMAPHPCLLPRMSTPPGCLSIASLHSMKGPERATTPLSCAQSLRVSISHTHPRHRHVRVHVDLPRSARRPPVPGCSWVNPPIDQDEAVRSPYAALRCA